MKAIIYLLIGALVLGSLAYGFNTKVAVGTSYFNGSVGIGTDSPTTELDVVGDVTISGDLDIGYSVIQNQCVSFSPGQLCAADCPANHIATGGGCVSSGYGDNFAGFGLLSVHGSFGGDAPTRYGCVLPSTGPTTTVQAHAVCLRIK